MEGSNVSSKKIASGLNLVTYSKLGGKPEPMNLTQTPPEIFKFCQQLEQAQETLIGVNSVNRGNPEASLRSGNALALVASQAIQFNSGLQASYSEHIEDVFTSLITMLQDYAVTPRIATIAGNFNRSYMQEFSSKDIDKVSRVVVDLGNSVMRTNAGRLEVANNLLQMQLATPDQYLAVINTGRLEPMYESHQKQLLLIRAENEAMSNGEPVMAIATDMHDLHIREHQCVLADPEARKNPQVTQTTLMHLNEHIDLKETVRPALLMALGMQPIPPDPQLMQDMQMQQMAQQGAMNTQQPQNAPNNLAMTEQQPPMDATQMSQAQPANPLAGQKFGFQQ